MAEAGVAAGNRDESGAEERKRGGLRLILPINAILIAGLALARVGFDQYVRFILPLMGILLAIILAVLLLGVAL